MIPRVTGSIRDATSVDISIGRNQSLLLFSVQPPPLIYPQLIFTMDSDQTEQILISIGTDSGLNERQLPPTDHGASAELSGRKDAEHGPVLTKLTARLRVSRAN